MTKSVKEKVENKTVIDAAGRPLGRLASEVALILLGKTKANYRPNAAPDSKVVVKNTDKIAITGKKFDQKNYWRFSGYPGGLKLTPLKILLARDSRLVIKKAIFGMLPKNRLRKQFIKGLILFKGEAK